MSMEMDDRPEGSEHDQDIGANLAFIRSLVSEGGQVQRSAGIAFLAGGLSFGTQCILQWAEIIGWLPYGLLGLVIGVGPTIVFTVIVSWLAWKDRKSGQKGVATRSLNAAFSSAGLANLVMVAVFAYVAITEKSILLWMLYPIVICALQGAVWYIAYMIRRKAWLAFVSAGWFVTTLILGLLIKTSHYVLVLGIALFVLMGGAGYTLMRLAKKQAPERAEGEDRHHG